MKNRTALITGAARRIGAAISRDLHAYGMDVIVHFNSSDDAAKSLVSELNTSRPGSAHLLWCDLRETDRLSGFIDTAFAVNSRLDVLINNASVFTPSPVKTCTPADWGELMNVNLKAPLFLSQAAAGYLAENQGCIINMTDIHGDRPLKNHTIYSISKAGLIMLTKSLARELGPDIRVNAISPGAILWPEDMDKKTRNVILSKTVMKHQGTPEDITSAVRFLIDEANYMTGQVIVIDGGRTLFS